MSIDELINATARAEVERLVGDQRPLYLTRFNAHRIGAPWRQVREIATSPDYSGEVLRAGKLILVEVNGFLDHLRSLDELSTQPERDAADEVLEEVLGPGTVRTR